MKKKLQLIILVSIILLGFVLRLRAVLLQSFWGDESSIFHVAIRNSLDSLIFIKHWDKCHPQLFYIFLHYWQKISTNIAFVRIPSLLAFIPSVLLVYKIGKKTNGYLMGILATLFFSTNHFFVNLGFQQKPYAFELMFMFTSIYFAQKILSEKNNQKESKKNKYLFIISSVLGFYTDYSFVWLWAAMWGSLIISFLSKKITKQKSSELFKIFSIATLFMSLQIPILIKALTEALGLEAYLGIPTYDDDVRHAFANFLGLINKIKLDFLIVGILNLLTLIFVIKDKQQNTIFLKIVLLLSFYPVLIISYLISQSNPIFLTRNIMASSFIFVFMPAFFISKLKNKIAKSIFTVIFVSYCIYIFPITFALKDGYQGRDPWSKVYQIAKSHNNFVSFVVITNKDYALDSLRDYYFGGHYDGTVIQGYNEKWIKTKDVENWVLEPSDHYSNFVIFLADPDQISEQMDKLMKIYNQICTYRNCYGPFSLQ